jgi:hypothetical protein
MGDKSGRHEDSEAKQQQLGLEAQQSNRTEDRILSNLNDIKKD